MSPSNTEAFAAHYNRGLLPQAAASLAAIRRTRGQAGATPAEAWALGGTVLLPDRHLEHGWVVIDGGRVAEVAARKPQSVLTLETGGVIMPGLIDLHGHPEWNVFAAWEPPHLYHHRTVWRKSAEFAAVAGDPMTELTKGFTDKAFLALLARYAEIRALVGGTTAVQGSSSAYPTAAQALVRHVDLAPFGDANAASLIDPLSPKKAADRTKIIAGINVGTITAFYAHLAEGIDESSRVELAQLATLKLLTPATVIIHGTALTEQQLITVRDVGAKLVWSPQSNLRLYGQTTAAATARRLGIPLALGADWLPSGSVGLLAELQVARRQLGRQGDRIDARALVDMVTIHAAKIAGFPRQLGRLAAGGPADILVLERHDDDPYAAVCRAQRSSVELVAIAGHLLYARDDWFRLLAPNAQLHSRQNLHATGELVWSWGKRMRLDVAAPADPVGHHPALPGLAGTRAQLLARYTRTGRSSRKRKLGELGRACGRFTQTASSIRSQ